MERAQLLAAAFAVLVALLALPAEAKKKNKRDAEPFGVVAGTVFQESGFALPGAEVSLVPAPKDDSAEAAKDVQKATTDRRGEFAFRVPAGAMRYTIEVEAAGWQPAEKTVEVQWDQRVTVTFRLRPANPEGNQQ